MTSRLPLPLAMLAVPVYFAVNAAILAWTRSGTSYDGAEQLLFTQYWDWGYGRSQPPLYTWLLRGLHEVFGVSIATENLLKFGLLATAFLLAFRLARVCGLDRRGATGSALALFLIAEVGWESQRNYSHSVLLIVSILAFAVGLLRLRVARGVGGFVLLGVLIAVAVLSKYNALFLIVALLAGDAVVSGRRALARDARLLVSVAVALLLVWPHLAWMSAHVEAVTALSGKLGIDGAEGALTHRAAGLLRLGLAILAVASPMMLVALLAIWRPVGALRDPAPAEPVRVLGWALFFGLALAVAAVIVIGVGRVEPRWLVPWAVLLGPVLLGTLRGGVLRTRAATALALAGSLAALVIAPILWLNGTVLGGRTQFDYAALMADIEAAGPVRSIVFSDYATYANLRLVRPDLALVHVFIPADEWLASLPAVAVWDGEAAPNAALAAELAAVGLAPVMDAARETTLRSRWTDEARVVRFAPLRPADDG